MQSKFDSHGASIGSICVVQLHSGHSDDSDGQIQGSDEYEGHGSHPSDDFDE